MDFIQELFVSSEGTDASIRKRIVLPYILLEGWHVFDGEGEFVVSRVEPNLNEVGKFTIIGETESLFELCLLLVVSGGWELEDYEGFFYDNPEVTETIARIKEHHNIAS